MLALTKKLLHFIYRPSLKFIVVPKHLAIIMDGNRRWAAKKSLSSKIGHYKGAENLKKIVSYLSKSQVKYLTVYAFSTENWNRDHREINELMKLLNSFLDRELKDLIKKQIKIKILGNLNKFPQATIDKIKKLEDSTKNFDQLQFNVALNYGGREEIIAAVQSYTKSSNKLDLVESNFKDYLYSKDIPDPDLIIRTGGEMRLSNFLLWQSAYTELYFSKKYWPDFNKRDLYNAFLNYSNRKRRFGV
jgi:undecaprenyl diphosphate synthase